MKYFIYCFKHYADFSGRARRKEFWFFALFNAIIALVLCIGFMSQLISLAIQDPDMDDPMALVLKLFTSPFYILLLIYGLAVLVPTLAVTVRRLHDIGRSGTWLIIYYIISFILGFLGAIWDVTTPLGILISLATLALGVIYIVWMATDSKPGVNEWGNTPKEVIPAQDETDNDNL